MGVLPFHHVMTVLLVGLEPQTSHTRLYGLSADKGRFSPCSLTQRGRTETIK